MTVTTDRNHPGIDKPRAPGDQNEAYLVLSEDELSKGYVRPLRISYLHPACGVITSMPDAIARTYARDPSFYGLTWCCGCAAHLPVAQFRWLDGQVLGS